MQFLSLLFICFAGTLFGECADVAVPAATPEAMRYYWSGNVLWIVQQTLSLLIPLLFLYTGWSGRLGSFAEKKGKQWFFSIALYLVFFLVIYQLFFLPFDFYADYIRQHAYGLSTQPFGRWFGNLSKELLVSIIGAVAFVWIFYLLLKKSPRRWWFYSSIASTAILFIILFIQPIWINPLFNQFGPMKDKALEEKILALAARAKIEHGRVFEVDMSRDTNMLNAYVTGFGSSNRIVLWDTTIEQLKTDEILFVMGHEMGHYVLHHVWWHLAYLGALSFLIFYFTYRSANYLMHRYSHRFGFSHLRHIASLPLLLFLITGFLLLSLPLSNLVSRTLERQADRFGLEITQNNVAAAEAFLVLQKKNLANPRPGPVFKIWRSTHPPLGERVDFCNRYCPWKENRPLHYGRYFN